MKLKLLSTLIAASFLAGCSSSGSSDNGGDIDPQDGIADVTYFQGENVEVARINGDEGEHNSLIIRGADGKSYVLINGQAYTVENNIVSDAEGQKVGDIQSKNGELIFVGTHGGTFVISVEDGRLIASDVHGPIDPDYGLPVTPSNPIYVEPSNPIEDATPSNPIEATPDNELPGFKDKLADTFTTKVLIDTEVLTAYSIRNDNNGNFHEVVIRRDGNGDLLYVEIGGTIFNHKFDGTNIEGIVDSIKDKLNDTFDIRIENDGKYLTVFNMTNKNNGNWHQVAIVRDSEDSIRYIEIGGSVINKKFDGSNIDRDNQNITKAELKQKIQSLSQEQRQQIKQAVKDRASRS
ncbi:hypothetical protein [Vibrio crassostreae]|uniref:hypothetical protein n=1 Tax=Vibrio crassostreae TaxID=246167 RepID=UPI000FBCE4A7|nr:hypothetical protein [Vibrio crassostreae]RPE97814.1 6-phosphogluconolactonase (cycloisomerase 2 family) [Vibrio crassostreae]